MNAFQTCKDTSDLVPLYLPQQLYVKPVAKFTISLQIPNVSKIGKSISYWEIMEKIKDLVKPEELRSLKVTKTTLEVVRLEGEVDSKKQLEPIVHKLHNKTIKLKNFSELMRLKAAIQQSDCPNRKIWDCFFQDAKDMNESKPGQRPDTVHLSSLPTKWFVPYHLLDEEDLLPSEKIFYKIFEKFGPIRYVDIPLCDPHRNKMKDHISGIKNCSLDNKELFEGYIQFKDYMGFTKCMDFLRGVKLVHKDEDETLETDIKVDFDRSKHLSDASMRRREIVRDRLIKKQKEKEEKERDEIEEKRKKDEEEKKKQLSLKEQKAQRRRLREEKRKGLLLEKLKIKSADEINAKIAKEEKKLMKVQRKLESIRLIEELFRRIKEKTDSNQINTYSIEVSRKANDELKRYKNTRELEVLNQKQKLHNAIQGRVMLKSALKSNREFSSSSSEEDAVSKPPLDTTHNADSRLPQGIYEPPLWYNLPYIPPGVPIYQNPGYNVHDFRGRVYPRGSPYLNSSRGRRTRGYRRNFYDTNNHHPNMSERYFKYFSRVLQNEKRDIEHRQNSSRRRSRSYSRDRKRKSTSRKRERSRSRTSTRSRSRTRKSRRSRTRSKSVDSSKFLSPDTFRKKRSRSWSLPKEREKNKRDSWSKSPERK